MRFEFGIGAANETARMSFKRGELRRHVPVHRRLAQRGLVETRGSAGIARPLAQQTLQQQCPDLTRGQFELPIKRRFGRIVFAQRHFGIGQRNPRHFSGGRSRCRLAQQCGRARRVARCQCG